MKVIGLGNALVDVIIPVKDDTVLERLRLPRGSMQLIDDRWLVEIQNSIAGLDLELASGGSASNTIHGLASLGVSCGFIGSVGQDEFGRFFETDQREKGILPELRYSDTPTGRAHAFVSQDSERTFGTYLGAALELGPADLSAARYAGYDWLYIEGYLVQNHALIEQAVKLAKDCGLKVALDLASYNVVEDNRAFLERILKDYVDLVFANEEESKAMTGRDPEGALDLLSSWCADAVVKTGSTGSLVRLEGETVRVEPVRANPVDTSGAGDLYAAGYLYGLSKGLNPYQSGQIGSVLSGRVIEYYGPKLPLAAWAEVLAQVKRIEKNA